MSEYVVCQFCGTRIKAGREYCLRCREPLPVPGAPVRTPLWVSLGLTQSQQTILAAGVALAVMALVWVIWATQPPPVDEAARPISRAPGTRANPPAAVGSSPAPPGVNENASAGPFEPAPVDDATAGGSTPADRAAHESQLAAYEQELANKPDDTELLNRIGLVLDQLGREAEAVPRYERAIALAPGAPRYHSNLARAAARLGPWDRAVGEYREAARLLPQDFPTQYTLALTLHRKGDDEDAISEFEKAVALAPGDPSVHLSLGISLETVGRVAEAVREYRRFIEMRPTSADAERLKAHVEVLTRARS